MYSPISLYNNEESLNGNIILPASKSISNRVLILNALSDQPATITNLSTARDTETMKRLLASQEQTLDVLDAGTTMRFLTAYLAVSDRHTLLTGSQRMCERPIHILVEALNKLGAHISYEAKDGFPPLIINGFDEQLTQQITIDGSVSSQFISALLMIGARLPKGLELKLTGKVGSRPYINMTLSLMKQFGILSSNDGQTLSVKQGAIKAPAAIEIEPDWSAASYWYAMVALRPSSRIVLHGLKPTSLQGDSVLPKLMRSLGVNTTFTAEGALLESAAAENHFSYDFSDCPDLAQTVAVVCAAKNITAEMTGLESLKIKETDRTAALQTELNKIGASFHQSGEYWVLNPDFNLQASTSFATYKDHRMAMALAPLGLLKTIMIEEPVVVNKSYPHFWEDLQKVGFAVSGE